MPTVFIAWLGRRAENIAVALLTAIFCSFILQIFSRYIVRQPLGWTLEACLLGWLWLVFWCTAFTLRDDDHVRFTILLHTVKRPLRRVFAIISGCCIVAAFLYSAAPTWDFIAFMAIEKTSLLKIRFDFVFGIYLIFIAAVVCRYTTRVIQALSDKDKDPHSWR